MSQRWPSKAPSCCRGLGNPSLALRTWSNLHQGLQLLVLSLSLGVRAVTGHFTVNTVTI